VRPPRGLAVHPEWNAHADAIALRKAMKGMGTDDKTVISIICQRDRDHLQRVRAEFEKNEKRDLVKDVISETSGNYEDVVSGLLLMEPEYRAKVVHNACAGAGTADSALIDALCTATGPQILAMKAAFQAMYKKDVVKVVEGDTSGNYRKLMVALLTGRKPVAGVDAASMNHDLDILYRATEGKVGTDEDAMIEILTARSHDHLAALNVAYVAKSKGGKRNFQDIVKDETSGNFTIAACALLELPAQWLCHRVSEACHGNGTDEKMLTRAILLGDAYVVQSIVERLRAHYKRDLIPYIKKETSGNYERALTTYVESCLRP